MDKNTKTLIMEKAREYMNSGWHCSEGVLMAVGAHYMDEINPQALRISTPFAAGIGGTNAGLCGALSGGLMVIGALHGRIDPGINDDHCMDLAASYRDKFLEHFSCSRCADLKDNWVGKGSNGTCADLVAVASGLLVDVLESEEDL